MIEHLRIRQTTEEKEESLSPYAQKSKFSRGREKDEPLDPIRTCFQRDRDRIIHSNSFRRLKHKTQVFINPLGDHFVTRLTHTLEVSQIARTIARALNLNEDLTEAISLGHDLGHTPFGHVGERVLNELFPGGFHHNEQSLRVVECIEKNGRGLNLTWEVRDGILNHSKTYAGELFNPDWGKANTFEGEVCKIADLVAYINHDIVDAIRAKVITEDDLPPASVAVLGRTHSKRINTMVTDIVTNSWGVSGLNRGDVGISMSPEVKQAAGLMRDFLFAEVYNSPATHTEAGHAKQVVEFLYRYFTEHFDKLPAEYRASSADTARQVVDYISNMTDQYAQNLMEKLK